MGFWATFVEIGAKRMAAEKGFNAGLKGEAPPQFSSSGAGRLLQQVSDDACDKGRQALLNKAAGIVIDRLEKK